MSVSRRAVDAAELAPAPGIGIQRPVVFSLVEILPEDAGAVVLGIGGLPDQEVRQPHFAGSADDEVRVGKTGRMEVGSEEVLCDFFRIDSVANNAPDRFEDLRPAAVI